MRSICAGCGGAVASSGDAVKVGSMWGSSLRADFEVRVCPMCREQLGNHQTELAEAIREILA